MLRLFNYFLIFFLFLFTTNLFSQHFKLNKVPEWVDVIDPNIESVFSKYDINNGLYTSLLDYQVNLNNETDFTHYKLKIVSDAGVSAASEIKLIYDSSYQRIDFHYLYIWRNGKKIDKTKDLSFEMMNNEKDLQFSIYSGLITSYDIIEDVRKGDIVEYAFSLIGDNPIFENYGYRIITLEDTNPVDYLNMKVMYSNDKEYNFECKNFNNDKIKITKKDTLTILNYSTKNIEAFEIEESTPPWITPYKHFIIGNYNSWENVNKWALSLFELETELNRKLDIVFEEIFREDFSEDEKIDAIINYVQNDIRYLGIENGIGSFKPFPPTKVIEQRYGDCKDKSLLLITLLKQIGIKNSFPALVSSNLLEGVENYMPGGQIFNHVIVYFQYNNKEYWIDPTISMQGGSYKTKCTPDYGTALIVGNQTDSLTKMNINDLKSRTELFEKIILPSYNEPGTIEITSKMYGERADFFRNVFEYYSIKEVNEQFKSSYGILYPNINIKEKLKISDDLEKNILTIKETYLIEDVWKKYTEQGIDVKTFKYEPMTIYNYISPMVCELKKYPVYVPYPSRIKQQTIIELPEKIEFNSDLNAYNNDAFKFTHSTILDDNKTVKISYDFYTKTKFVSANEFKQVCKDLNNITEDLPITVYYKKEH